MDSADHQAQQQQSNQEPGAAPAPDTLEIRVNLKKMTFGDLELADKFQTGDVEIREILPFLNRVVVGGVRDIPLDRMEDVFQAISDALEGMQNPKN